MKTNYESRIISPFVVAKGKVNIQDKKHPVQEEIRKNIGSYTITAVVEEDGQTLDTLKHIPGLIAYICTLTQNGKVVGQGRGTAVLSGTNRYIERNVRSAFNASVLDAMAKSRMLDTLCLENKVDLGEAYRATFTETDEPITERQRSYLSELLNQHVEDDKERSQRLADIDGMSKTDASEMIALLANSR